MMLSYQNERIALFIDGPNFYGAVKALQWEVNYSLLQEYFSKQGQLLRCYYYTAVAENQESNSLKRLLDFLTYNGITVVSKAAKEVTDYSTGTVTLKGNMDVEITIGMLKLAPHLDHLILCTGDGDFRALVEELQGMGKRVTVVSTLKAVRNITADELRRQADNFIELDDLRTDIARDPALRVSTVA